MLFHWVSTFLAPFQPSSIKSSVNSSLRCSLTTLSKIVHSHYFLSGFIQCYCHSVQVCEVKDLVFLIYYCIPAPSIVLGTVCVTRFNRYSTAICWNDELMNRSCLKLLLVSEKRGVKNWGSSEVGWSHQGHQSKTRAKVRVFKGQLEEMLWIHIWVKILRKNGTTKWQKKIVEEDTAKSQRKNWNPIGRGESRLTTNEKGPRQLLKILIAREVDGHT